MKPRCAVACLLVATLASACGGPRTAACPGQFNPSRLSDKQLRRANIGRIPERGATTQETVNLVTHARRDWIKENYEGVVDVGAGAGWGVTFTRNELGDITFHREDDFIIVTDVAKRSDCPDPERGTLFVFAKEDPSVKVPVRFEYRTG